MCAYVPESGLAEQHHHILLLVVLFLRLNVTHQTHISVDVWGWGVWGVWGVWCVCVCVCLCAWCMQTDSKVLA